jgi:hypothetical protein
MAIHEPGRSLMKHVGLQFVEKKIAGGGHRSTNANLSLTSMIDFLVVTVVFLLMSFSASGETPVAPGLTLPKAANYEDMLNAPVVSIHNGLVLLDGARAGETRTIEENNVIITIPELLTMLKARKDTWKLSHPANEAKDLPSAIILQIDQHVKAVVVKSVFKTAALAGYPNINFMVDTLAKSGE